MEFERIADKKRLQFITSALLENTPRNATVLDVGCGNGLITVEVGKSGYVVTGIDASEASIDTARSLNNLPNVTFVVVAAGNFTPPPDKYAAIICSEVLEHLDDPLPLLNTLHQSLLDNGILIVTVPNGAGPRELFVTRPIQYLQKKNNVVWKSVSALKKHLGYTGTTVQSNADDLTHLQFFTYKSLSRLAHAAGFSIVKFSKTNFIEQVFPFSLLFKRSKALQKLDCRIADVLPKMFTSGFMTVWRKKQL
jgi:2-polyprenyl-3-methyl-5-hydroxy-6-metoxy-1,4-benzoquinol methylase